MFMKAKPRLSYCFCKVKCAKSQHFSFAGGFAGTPSLAVGLFYTCILQGARQVQGPCCTNPRPLVINVRRQKVVDTFKHLFLPSLHTTFQQQTKTEEAGPVDTFSDGLHELSRKLSTLTPATLERERSRRAFEYDLRDSVDAGKDSAHTPAR